MRIAFVLPNLSGGGAARVASVLCSQWASSGHDVHLMTFEEVSAESAYPICCEVDRHRLGFMQSPRSLAGFAVNNLQRVSALRAEFARLRPDVAVAFLLEANVSTVIAARSACVPVLVSERNHPAYGRISTTKALLRRALYPRASGIIVQTEAIRRWFVDNLGVNAAVIPNPVEASAGPRITPSSLHASSRRRMVSLGRLEPQKGFDRLIEAFAVVAAEAVEWDLVIFGEGGERKRLEGLVSRHGLSERVQLRGVTRNPREELRASDLYVHAARYEGYPNALIEALSEGLCVIATDCPGATSEILQGGSYGILVPDAGVAEIAAGLRSAVFDEELRRKLAAKARDAIVPLAPGTIAARWIEEFERVLAARR